MAIIPVSDKFNDYAQVVHDKLRENGIRVNLDTRNEKMGAKIRNAELSKIPVMIILGEKEVESSSISVRRRFVGNQGSVDLDSFIESSVDEIKQRAKSPASSDG